MKFEQFVGQVQNRAQLPNQGETMRAICATLETLGERLNKDEASHLAAQLPPGVGDYLRLAKNQKSYSLDEFFEQVAERQGAGVDLPDAVYHARVVFEVLQEAVTQGQLNNVRDQLPPEYNVLFEAGSEGAMSRTG